MSAYLVCFGAGQARRYLTQAWTSGETENGWRPLTWVREMDRAELFSSQKAARTYALERLGHSLWEIAIAPGRGVPTDDLGGTPAAIRLAA